MSTAEGALRAALTQIVAACYGEYLSAQVRNAVEIGKQTLAAPTTRGAPAAAGKAGAALRDWKLEAIETLQELRTSIGPNCQYDIARANLAGVIALLAAAF